MRSIHRLRRRDMLGISAAAGLSALALPAIAQDKSPNEKLSIAGIGVGGQGGWDIGNCTSENIVALCDVDDRRCEATVKKFPKAKRYRDFRKMLEEMDGQIDAVVVGTPDHVHAPASAMAMRMGKHCYCEKPLTHTVREARVLAQIANERSWPRRWARRFMPERITAASSSLSVRAPSADPGSPRVAGSEIRRAAQTGRCQAAGRPKTPRADTLDWDLWLGPAPFRPYHEKYVPFHWRYWWAFGNGSLGDFFCHYCDLAFWAAGIAASAFGRGRRTGPPGKHRAWTIAARSTRLARTCRR